MGGMGKLFARIIPIITLVCFICLGITKTFDQLGNNNLTYLTEENINYGTEENPQTIKYYNLDVYNYLTNITTNTPLERAIEKTLDIETYRELVDSYKYIWQDGYQFGDGIHTIINSLILIIDTYLVGINFILLPIRLISALFLTAFTFGGININSNGIVISLLNGFIEFAAIPLIPPTYNAEDNSGLTGNMYNLNNTINWDNRNYDFKIQFTDSTGTTFNGIHGIEWKNKLYFYYGANNEEFLVYDGQWLSNIYQYITIIQVYPNSIANNYWEINNFLSKNATEIDNIPISPYYGRYYTWNETTLNNWTLDTQLGFDLLFKTDGYVFTQMRFTKNYLQKEITYQTLDSQQNPVNFGVYLNGNWLNNNYKTFMIYSTQVDSGQANNIEILVRNGLITQIQP